MKAIIRFATVEDCSSIHQLIVELSIFEREPDQVILRVEDLEKDGFSANPLFQCLVAQVGNEIVGMALFYPRYSTWRGPTLHLEDLIVKKEFTKKGIGTKLYMAFIEHAYVEKVQRIEWAVLDWNQNAIDFYKKSGARLIDDWRIVQMTRKQMESYLNAE
ncbi:MAG: GNAT family N-acetyltransferase [Flavobacteriaceae bacterium]|nr:GNAT family N-acetyltransferase [Flavobacteriaceae bacterium]